MSVMRLPLRLARREVRRRPGRTSLVALLVALPVAAMVVSTALIHTGSHTADEDWQRSYGQADAIGRPDVAAPALEVALPEGSRVVTAVSSYFRARTADGRRSDIELSDLPLLDPLTVGIHELTVGRAPTTSGEMALSRGVARRLQVGVGDELVLTRPGIETTVVGIIDPVGCLSCPYAVVAPGTLPGPVIERYGSTTIDLIDLPTLDAREQQAFDMLGLEQRSTYGQRTQGGPDDARAVRWSLVLGAIALTVVGIVISAAFAVGARRQLVTLGQLSASGASPGVVRSADRKSVV